MLLGCVAQWKQYKTLTTDNVSGHGGRGPDQQW